MDEDDIQIISEQYLSNFVTYKLIPGIYTIKDISEIVYTMVDHEGALQIEYDDVTMKTKLILTPFGASSGSLRFDERSVFNTSLGPAPYWDYNPTRDYHVDTPGVYTSDKNLKVNTIKKYI